MTDDRAKRWVWIAALGYVANVALLIVVEIFTLPPPAVAIDGGGGDVAFILVVLPFTIAGFTILAKQPRNHVGWILVAIGFVWIEPLGSIGELLLSRGLPGGAALVSIAGGTWAPPIALMGTVLLLRFPTGELLSRRWRWVERVALVDIAVIVLSIACYPGGLEDIGYPGVTNPLSIPALAPVVKAILPVALMVLPITLVLSAASLVMRFRRSRGVERLQMKWFTTAAASVALLYLVAMLGSIPASSGGSEAAWVGFVSNLSFYSFVLIPIAIVIAVLRYKLYEIDVVISKAIVYGALALFVTVAYIGIVVGLGQLVGSDRSVPLQIAATVLVAVAFQPLRERVQRFANRLVYRKRATPYEVLARFSEQVAGTYATDEIAAALARLLVEGIGADRAEIWLEAAGGSRFEATWPADAASRGSVPPAPDDLTAVVPVLHQGEALGTLVIRKAPNDPVSPADEKLLEDVAGQAGLVLRNVRLVDDLRTSRQRLVAARDTERRKLERNIHDGAQQRLVALAVLYNMAAGLAKPLGPEQQAAIADLGVQSQGALETLRDLARGIYPAVLSDQGIVAAIQGQARKAPLPVDVVAHDLGRYDQGVEAAVYFCCLEALQNVAKYAQASSAVVQLAEMDGAVRFSVSDDGVGFDRDAVELGSGTRNMQDRLAAIGGRLEVVSESGRGTTVHGEVPIAVGRPLAAVG
jgi:signal transduction histidine kinase